MRKLAIPWLLALFVQGCATAELHRDQDKLRTVVLDLYTNQIIDNLIRAKTGMPFIHIDYATITGNVTAKETASFGGNQEVDSTSAVNILTRTATGTLASATRLFKNFFSYGTSGENTNQVSMVGTPVNNVNEVYEAYFEYLKLPDAIIVSDERPPEAAVHICKKHCGKWYWVPVEHRYDFLQLAMATTATRGKRMAPLDEFFTVALVGIQSEKPAKFSKDAVFFTLKLDKPIPNDEGRLELILDKKTYGFQFSRQPDNLGLTDKLSIAINPKVDRFKDEPRLNNLDTFRKSFPYPAKVYLETHRPQPPTVKELIDQLNNQLEIIKLNQLR